LLFDLLKNCIGDSFYPARNTFLTGEVKPNAPIPSLSNCRAVRILSVSEPNTGGKTCELNCEFVKSMTGKYTITTRKLYQDQISYIPQFNLFLQCNDKPDIPKLDDGIGRRLRVIDYPFKFVDNPKNPGEKKVNKKLKVEFKND